jgi:hypothetical protein
MRFSRFLFGSAISAAWLAVMVYAAMRDPSTTQALKPHEWGDFFAGFFAPLAFLWLVLGYLQQGDELQLSTKALQLQAEELRNSVEQQRELVEVTRQQLAGEREALALERLNRTEAAKPLFVIQCREASFGGPTSTYNIVIQNAGNTVTQVVGMLSGPEISTSKLIDVSMFTRSSEGPGSIRTTGQFPLSGASLDVAYLDAFGQPGSCRYKVYRQSEEPNSLLAFRTVEA